MFRMAFHGGFGNVWNALMTIPEARQVRNNVVVNVIRQLFSADVAKKSYSPFQVKRCMNKQEACLAYEAIRKEAGGDGENDKPRLIVNPDFVEQMVREKNFFSPERCQQTD